MVRVTVPQSVITSRELQRGGAQQGKIFVSCAVLPLRICIYNMSIILYYFVILFYCLLISALVYAASLFTTQVDLPLRKTAVTSGINGYQNSRYIFVTP